MDESSNTCLQHLDDTIKKSSFIKDNRLYVKKIKQDKENRRLVMINKMDSIMYGAGMAAIGIPGAMETSLIIQAVYTFMRGVIIAVGYIIEDEDYGIEFGKNNYYKKEELLLFSPFMAFNTEDNLNGHDYLFYFKLGKSKVAQKIFVEDFKYFKKEISDYFNSGHGLQKLITHLETMAENPDHKWWKKPALYNDEMRERDMKALSAVIYMKRHELIQDIVDIPSYETLPLDFIDDIKRAITIIERHLRDEYDRNGETALYQKMREIETDDCIDVKLIGYEHLITKAAANRIAADFDPLPRKLPKATKKKFKEMRKDIQPKRKKSLSNLWKRQP